MPVGAEQMLTVGGVDAHPQHGGSLPAALVQVPVDGGGLAVPHGRNDSSQGAARDGAQALLHPLRDVDRIQISFVFRHKLFLPAPAL